jgi:hypothetical protein
VTIRCRRAPSFDSRHATAHPAGAGARESISRSSRRTRTFQFTPIVTRQPRPEGYLVAGPPDRTRKHIAPPGTLRCPQDMRAEPAATHGETLELCLKAAKGALP